MMLASLEYHVGDNAVISVATEDGQQCWVNPVNVVASGRASTSVVQTAGPASAPASQRQLRTTQIDLTQLDSRAGSSLAGS
jgi:hypothetical protein